MSRFNRNGSSQGSMGGGPGGYQQRGPREHEPLSKTNVFIRGLTPEIGDQDLHDLCSKFGNIVSAKSIIDRVTNECKGYGFVNFENADDAAVAVRELANEGYQARMSKENMGKSDRPSYGDRRSPPDYKQQTRNGNGAPNGNIRFSSGGNGGGGGGGRLSKTNLYLRGLEPTTSDEDLHQLCVRYGNIVSAKAIIDRNTNECKGYGFVNFDSPYAAEQAVMDLQQRGYQVQMSRENRTRQPMMVGGPVSATWQ